MPKVTRIEFANEPEKQKKRVAVYCRVSSGSADQLNSLANQEKYYAMYVKRHTDWTLVDVFADEAITGTRADIRPEFQRMIRMCELKQIDMIITKSMARFARNTKDSLEYTKKLKLLGVAVIFEKEGINTLSVGDEMLINTFAAIAEEESMSISQNLRLANKKRMESGEYVCSNAPYGYRLINKQLVIEPTEAGVVREIYELYLSGLSADDIADKLTGDNKKPAIGKRWSRTSVAYILSNEKYIGDSLYQKKYGPPTVPFTKKYNKGCQPDALNLWKEQGTSQTLSNFILYNTEEAETRSSYQADVDTYVKESLLKFVMGKEPLDNFETFQQNLKDMHIEDLIAVEQAALDRYNAR